MATCSVGSTRWLLTTLVLLAVAAPEGLAQDKYPTRPIRIIVPTSAGGGGDTSARVINIPYKGPAPGIMDLLGGRIAATATGGQPHIIPHVRSGKLRALGVTCATRAAALPDIPTIAEGGLPGYEVVQWSGLLAPAGTPRAGLCTFSLPCSSGSPCRSRGLPTHNDAIMRADPDQKLPQGVKPARRIVVMDRQAGKSCLVSDGPSPDVRTDPARPGFASQRMWVTDGTPAKIVLETLHLPHTIEPPANGSVLRVLTFPPDESWRGKVGAPQVQAYFRTMGSPGASTYSPQAPHPYMQKTRTLDFCIVLEGEIVLVLDTQEVHLKAGEFVVQRGTNHAWSNRSDKPAIIAIASHDGKY